MGDRRKLTKLKKSVGAQVFCSNDYGVLTPTFYCHESFAPLKSIHLNIYRHWRVNLKVVLVYCTAVMFIAYNLIRHFENEMVLYKTIWPGTVRWQCYFMRIDLNK